METKSDFVVGRDKELDILMNYITAGQTDGLRLKMDDPNEEVDEEKLETILNELRNGETLITVEYN